MSNKWESKKNKMKPIISLWLSPFLEDIEKEGEMCFLTFSIRKVVTMGSLLSLNSKKYLFIFYGVIL